MLLNILVIISCDACVSGGMYCGMSAATFFGNGETSTAASGRGLGGGGEKIMASEEEEDVEDEVELRRIEDLEDDDVDAAAAAAAASFIARRWYSSPIAEWSSEVSLRCVCVLVDADADTERITGGALVLFTCRRLLPDAGL